jgi:hypothetical protein
MMLQNHMNPLRWALLSVILLIAGLLGLGIAWLDVPPIYKLTHNTLLLYRGNAIIALAISLAIFHRWAAYKMLWLGEKIHRWMSALAMLGIIWIEATMHLLSIPHMEGWWIALFSGGMASGIAAWIKGLSCIRKVPPL